MGRILSLCIAVLVATATSMGSALAGKTLQINFMNVGQGDGAILVTPGGKTVMFDDGVANNCDRPLGYLEEIGVRNIDIHIASHYHADHIGYAAAVFAQHPLTGVAYDRGHAYPTDEHPGEYFVAYRGAVDGKRIEAKAGDSFKLDGDAEHPVVITFVAVNGRGLATENENALSLVAVIEHAGFRAEIGGDLSGEDTPRSASSTRYRDIETSVADLVGEIDLYKVHHHCSAYSTNETWLSKTKPNVAVISVGNGDRYGHPAEDCVNRLHSGGVKRICWTENGKGVDPEPPIDVVSGTVVVEVEAG